MPKTKTVQTLSLASAALHDAYTDFILSRQAMNCTSVTMSSYRFTAGKFLLGNQTYYVQQKLHGRSVTIWVDRPQRELGILLDGRVIKKLRVKGLQNRRIAFGDFVDWMAKEADSAWRRSLRRTPINTRSVT